MPVALQLDGANGKRDGLRAPAPPPSGSPHLARLLHVSDGHTTYMVDTGAQISVLPASQLPEDAQLEPSKIQLSAANGSDIATRGFLQRTIQLGSHNFTWQFLIANVQTPIIGADFLLHYELAVDLSGRTLLLPSGDILVAGCTPTLTGISIHGLKVGSQQLS